MWTMNYCDYNLVMDEKRNWGGKLKEIGLNKKA